MAAHGWRQLFGRWAVLVVAMGASAISLVPAGWWAHPAIDAIYTGFDPQLIYVAAGSGTGDRFTVDIHPARIDLSTTPSSQPQLNFITTPFKKFVVRMDVVVTSNAGAPLPIRLGVWSPWNGAGVFVIFGPAPDNEIHVDVLTGGQAATSLLGGRVSNSTSIDRYSLGTPYRVEFTIDKDRRAIETRVLAAANRTSVVTTSSSDAPGIFDSLQLAVSASTVSGAGNAAVTLSNYRLVIPHQVLWANRVDDLKVRGLMIGLSFAGLLLIVATLVGGWRKLSTSATAILPTIRTGADPRRVRLSHLMPAAGVFVYLVLNWLLFALGSHPFDMSHERLYAYVARSYGTTDLYFLPNLISTPSVWGGVPYIEASFPYEPAFAYLDTAIGWFDGSFLAGGTLNPESIKLEYLIKAVNVLFGLADGVLIYTIARRLMMGPRSSLAAAALFVFNPDVLFNMSVWGQTHVISIFSVLVAVLLSMLRRPLGAWVALEIACLTRPQMIVLGFLLGIVILRMTPWRETIRAVSWSLVLVFLVLLPITLATEPSLPFDVLLNNFRVQEAGGNQAQLATVSQDAYSIWPLVTYVANGAGGAGRAFVSSATPLIGAVTYQQVSVVLTVVAMLLVAWLISRRPVHSTDLSWDVSVVGLGIALFLMLLTGVVATYFVLVLPFWILSKRQLGWLAYGFVVATWTITTLVAMYGDMGVVVSVADHPLLAASRNAVTRFFVQLYSSDRFINVAVVANVCAIAVLAWAVVRSRNGVVVPRTG